MPSGKPLFSRFLEVEFTTEAGESSLEQRTVVSRGGVGNGVDWASPRVFFGDTAGTSVGKRSTVPKVQSLPQSFGVMENWAITPAQSDPVLRMGATG